MWMDNLFCAGNETELSHCPFDGWLKHDCNTNEAAGVICRLGPHSPQPLQPLQQPLQPLELPQPPRNAFDANQVMNTGSDLQAFQPLKQQQHSAVRAAKLRVSFRP